MLGVIIGVASVILLVSFGSGLQGYITGQLEGIGSNLIMVMPGNMDLKKMGQGGGGGVNFMNSKLMETDAKLLKDGSSLIKASAAIIIGQSAVKYNDGKIFVEVQGLPAGFTDVINSPLAAGDYFTETDDRAGKKVVILGSKVAEDLFGLDNPVGERVIIGENRFQVVGVLKNRGVGGSDMEDNVVIPFLAAGRIFNKDRASALYAQAVSSDKIDLAVEETKLILLNRLSEDDFTVLTQKEMLTAVSSILGVLTSALAGIAAISLIVGGIGIMNIMLVSVTERTREIGLRKALGATPNIILLQFLIEAVILSVGGGIIGILIGGGGALLAGQVIPTEVTPWAIILSFATSVIVGVVFGVMPARRAAKLSPIEALRYE